MCVVEREEGGVVEREEGGVVEREEGGVGRGGWGNNNCNVQIAMYYILCLSVRHYLSSSGLNRMSIRWELVVCHWTNSNGHVRRVHTRFSISSTLDL